MKTKILLLLFLIPVMMFGQKFNKKGNDPKKGNEILIGKCTREGFSTINSDFDSAYRAEYSLYSTEKPLLPILKEQIQGIKIVVVFGTWCGDSKEWIPRFMKVMDEINFPMKNIKLIGVDRDKKAGNLDIAKYNIERVPTFIFYRDRKELGRIIEVPVDILEKEILNISMIHKE
jgi:thiol-disulfide isomerase/thioredoxin